jgi:hypothetical protein
MLLGVCVVQGKDPQIFGAGCSLSGRMASWGENALIVLLLRMCAIDYNQRAMM